MKRTLTRATLVAALAVAAFVVPGAARAAPPANDDFANAAVVAPASLPFSDVVDNSGATTETGEPGGCIVPPVEHTVWYAYTPSVDQVLRADTGGSNFSTHLEVFQSSGAGFGGLNGLVCQFFGTPAIFSATAGTTYYIQVGAFPFGGGGSLHLNLVEVPEPANDDFAAATPISALPFTDTQDTTAGDIEPGEPTPSCMFGLPPAGSVWYSFTPSQSGSISALAFQGGFSTGIAAYTGASLGTLSEIGCRSFGGLLTVHVDAGTTYYFQAGGIFGGRGTLQVRFDVAPDPVASFGLNPGDPSIYDTVQLMDFSNDPGGNGFQNWSWTFGDGATSSVQQPQHRYGADGDYNVTLTVTTTDGRTASTTQVVHVRTHDVAIASLSVPGKGRVGRASPISVGVSDLHYGETVQVQLFKSTPGGFQLVGTLTQTIPATSKKKSVPFSFNYTFTSDDATVGKVTFQAVATIVGARDAVSTDNTLNSLPVPVSQ